MIPGCEASARPAYSSCAVYLDAIGCRLNQAEMESLAAEFLAAGCDIAVTPEAADLAVVNSCTVTMEADRDSRQRVRQLHACNPAMRIAVTGCWSTLHAEEAAKLPGVHWVSGNSNKQALAARMLGECEPATALTGEVAAGGFRGRTRAFLPAQLGCDFACAYCVTRLARGSARSVPAERVVAGIRAAERAGAQEAVITGVQLGAWGKDLGEARGLRALVEAILSQTCIPRIRLSSLEPWNVNPALWELWADPRLCPHLHLPLQSGSAATLQRMARPNTPEQFSARVREARQAIPGVAITTDLMVGFPGETDREFQESVEFVRTMEFAHGHLFTFSARPGTAAATMTNHIPRPVAKRRAHIMDAILHESNGQFLREHLGTELEALWEAAGPGGVHHGWTRNGIRVRMESEFPLRNRRMQVRGMAILNGELRVEPVPNRADGF
jgi:threonylcarbamoyladenosine tRNA methylthiotransferase MtaB